MLKKIVALIRNPYRIALHLNNKGLINWMPDKYFLKMAYRAELGKRLNLKEPSTYNEKLQWLKLYNRDELYTRLVDKYEVKEYVSQIIGNDYIIPTLGVWDRFEDIDFDELPEQFVLKCTHDSGGIVICKNKQELDIDSARQRINKCLKVNYYKLHREWPYKHVKPRIIAEKYMEDESGYELKDFKFFCFNGVPKAMFIATDRSNPNEETKFDFYDMNFNHMPFRNGHPNSKKKICEPKGFEEMKKLAAELSKGMPHVRVDFYDINGRVYFGEMTFFHWSGFVPFEPEKWDKTFGDWIELPKEN